MAEAVKFVGVDTSGGPLFDVVVSIPDRGAFEVPCTERQQAAVAKLYGEEIGQNLGFVQAHKLLSYWEYARACVEALFFGQSDRLVPMFTYLVAAYISSQVEIAAYSAERSNNRFRASTEKSRAARTKHYSQVGAFCQKRLAEIDRGARGGC